MSKTSRGKKGTVENFVPPKKPGRTLRRMCWNKEKRCGMTLLTVGTTEVLYAVNIFKNYAHFQELRHTGAGIEVCRPYTVTLVSGGGLECNCLHGLRWVRNEESDNCMHASALAVLLAKEKE